MPLNSVNTNLGAAIALQSLNRTADELGVSQKRVSTGFRVSDARDDGAAFAVAERIRGDIAATNSANQQLGGVKGLLDVTNKALESVSDTLKKVREIAVKLADGTITTEQRVQYQAQAAQLTQNIKAYIQDASYNGTNILDDPASLSVKVITTGSATYYTFSGYSALAGIYSNLTGIATWDRSDASNGLTAGGDLNVAITNTLSQLNAFGSYSNYIDNQIVFNKSILDAQEAGLGFLIDADLAKESARLQALQIRQQLGTQSLSIANQAPQSLLSLFGGR